jgi:perosamine synthetase
VKPIPISKPSITDLEIRYVSDAVKSGWVSSLGPYIEAFEAAFAKFCGCKYALTTSNGTTGLHLALEALGIGAGDEVIVPDLTVIATANAVAYTGAVPVPVDVDSDSLCIDPAAIKQAISPKTKALIPVHLYGHPADMDAVMEIAREFCLAVVEDAAEAHGATYRGKRVGALSHCGVFSFYGNKIITTGEGGMLTTNDPALYSRAKMLRDHAMSPERRYWHPERGFNYRMTNMQAALGLAQLERIDELRLQRAEVVSWYREAIHTSPTVRLNYVAPWATSAYWMVCLEVDWFDEVKRSTFMDRLRQLGIDSRPYFYPMSSMPMYKAPSAPVAARKSKIGVNLPSFKDLAKSDVLWISSSVNQLLRAMMPQ